MNVHDIVGFFSLSTRERIATRIENDHLAAVTEPHHVLTFGPVGSENRVAFAYRRVVDGQVEARIVAGCWEGTVSEFLKRIRAVHGYQSDTYSATHHGMYIAFYSAAGVREQQWRDEYEPPKPEPKAWIELTGANSWRGYVAGRPNHYAGWGGFDAKVEAEAWLARQLADDEPERCSAVSVLDVRRQCRLHEGHAQKGRLDHYFFSDSDGYCDYEGCIRVPHHIAIHLFADGTEVSA